MATAVAEELQLQEDEILWAAHRQLEKMRVFIYRVFAVISLFVLAPYLLAAYVATVAWRHVYLRVARWRWPDLEVVSPVRVRALMDTRRNQALLTAVVGLRTAVDLAALQARLSERLVELCEPGGGLRYPRLRYALTTAWGRYAWREEDAFQLEAHVVAAPSLPAPAVDHPWAQQAASDVAARFLPHHLSPWQVALLPGGRVVVIRLHHLLQAEGPRLLDMVSAVCAAALLQEDDEIPPPMPAPSPPPAQPTPVLRALPALWAALQEMSKDALRAAVARWEPKGGAAPRDLPALLAVVAGAWAAAGCEELATKTRRPHITTADALRAISPPAVFWASLRVWWWVAVVATVRLPLWWAMQVAQLVARGRRSALAAQWRLAAAAGAELRWLCLQLLDGPLAMLQQALHPGNASARSMRAGSFTGRKVVAWSRRVQLPEGADATSLLAAATLSLRGYFQSLHAASCEDAVCSCPCPLPARVLCLAGVAQRPGLLALPLPTNPACDFAAPGHPQVAETLWLVRHELRLARRQQALLQRFLSDDSALPRLLPSTLVRVLLNAASRCYPVRVSIIPAVDELVPASESLVLWQPPQGNVCLSLSLLLEKNGTSCRLAVMADAFVTPHHAAIAEAFPDAVNTIAQVMQEQRQRPAQRSRSQSPDPSHKSSPASRPETPLPSPGKTPPPTPTPDKTPPPTPHPSSPCSSSSPPAPSPPPTPSPPLVQELSPPDSQHASPPTPARSPH
ncbi:uncharacterized protein LOC126323926 isoform X1 [Schistocerca gregaria]|uniref:uncharacterized protein LOC126323926 isoform X1 n=2 Tax=Schistocerca gregaria TaxID=7010 RepID=UPI00211EAB86|nr:uncharacterized protein LOC126323926 isoform X1 [Schistocerca gregaria]